MRKNITGADGIKKWRWSSGVSFLLSGYGEGGETVRRTGGS